MTITVTISRWSYVGNGSRTIFPYTNRIFEKTDLAVSLDGVLQTVDTDYTVSGIDEPAGGNVTFTVAPGNNVSVTIVRTVPATQESSLPKGGPFPSDIVEKALDKLTILVQQEQDGANRRLQLQDIDPAASIDPLPLKTELASKNLAFDANGNPIPSTGVIEFAVTAFIQTLLDDLTQAEAQGTLGVRPGIDVQVYDANNAVTDVAQEYTKAQNFNGTAITTTLRPENVLNGTFDTDTNWTKGTGWTISGGVADVDGTQVADSDLEQVLSPTLADGISYLVEFDVLNYTAGNLTPILGGTSGTTVSANGSYSEYILAGSTDEKIIFRADLNGDMQIDNVSVREVDLDWDLDDNQVATVTLDRPDVVLDTPFNPKEGGTYILIVKQDATGGRNLTFSNNYLWADGIEPILGTDANAVNVLSFVYDGNNMLGQALANFS